MSPQTLLSEILNEAANLNPHASPQQILEGFFNILEREVLPSVIRDTSLPTFPSWAKITADMKRMRVKKKFRPKETLKEKRSIIQQVEFLRKLNWDGVDTATPNIYFSGHDNLISLPQLGMSFEIKPAPEKSAVKAPSQEIAHKPYSSVPFPSRKRNRFSLSNEIQEKIISDTRLENVFRNVEISIRRLIETRNLETYLDVSSKSDLEIPTWEKYVITVSLPPRMNFDEKMKIWEIIDLTIRGKISDLSKKVDQKTREYLDEINKKLFVHMEL